jgi:hypothetical protein
MQHEDDKYSYQGHEFHFIGFDQLEQFTETQYLFMIAQIRSSSPSLRTYVRSTANPGGIGHGWVKRRFITGKEPRKIYYDEFGNTRQFIPATVFDNPTLLKGDPDYVNRLRALPYKERKALLEGNWDSFEGQFFDMWDPLIHVIEPFEIPKSWKRLISIDYGYTSPSAVLFWAVDNDDRMILYREIYEERLVYSQLANRILSILEPDEIIAYAVADPSIWGDRPHHVGETRGESGAETMQKILGQRVRLIKGDNRRVIGWNRMRERLKPYMGEDGKLTAGMLVFSTCKNFIRTVPELIHDSVNPEDLDTSGEDHCLVAETKVETPYGSIPICELGESGLVFTPSGLLPYRNARRTRRNQLVWTVYLSDGRRITATGDHRVMLASGVWRQVCDLRCGDILLDIPNIIRYSMINGYHCNQEYNPELPWPQLLPLRAILPEKREAFASSCMGVSPWKDSERLSRSSQRWEQTQQCAIQPIFNRQQETFSSAWQTSRKNCSFTPSAFQCDPRGSQMAQEPCWSGVASETLSKLQRSDIHRLGQEEMRKLREGLSCNAQSIKGCSILFESMQTKMEEEGWGGQSDENLSHLWHPILRQQIRSHSYMLPSVRMVAPSGYADTYCLTVIHPIHAFVVQGGLVVSNCADSARMAVMSRPYHSPQEPAPPSETEAFWNAVKRDMERIRKPNPDEEFLEEFTA